MRYKVLFLLALLIGTILVAPVSAQEPPYPPGYPTATGDWGFWNGNELLSANQWYQMGYVAGAFDALLAVVVQARWNMTLFKLISEDPGDRPFRYTIDTITYAFEYVPENITLGQLHAVVMKYLNEHPQSTHN